MTELSGYRQKRPPAGLSVPPSPRAKVHAPSVWFYVAAIFLYVAAWQADDNADKDEWLQDWMGFLWRSHVVQALGFSEKETAAYLGTPYGSQGDLANLLHVDQATISRAQKRIRSALAIAGWDFDFAPKEGRRALYRPRIQPAA